jgi:iron complex outermembrane recepter protein
MAFLLLATATVYAQANTGDVAGRVLNAQTGRYLNNARVTVQGTSLSAFTNDFGEYRLNNVPAGPQELVVFFSGLGDNLIPVNVVPGQVTTQNVTLGGSVDDDTIVLDAFTVASGRDTDIASIAVNEQRFSPNIKTVIEADAFGDIAEGNVGEFLKFLPGVTVDYVAADVRTVSVRGFGAQFSSVYVDGFRMASSASGSTSRVFEFEQVSINNASRIEVSKVPTPSMPADSLGGAVNLISKNAFEREGAQFNYRLYLNMNSEEVVPKKTPGPKNKGSYKTLPGIDFDYTLPVSKNLGFVITGLSSNQYNEQHRSQNTWNFAQGGGTYTPPGGTSTVLPTATAPIPTCSSTRCRMVRRTPSATRSA